MKREKKDLIINAVKAVAFLLILAIVSINTYRVLSWKDPQGIEGLYRSEPNRIDVLFVGSSHSFCTVNTATLWSEYGIAADDIGENGQTFVSSKYYLREALKTQLPKVVFVELRGANFEVGFANGNLYCNTVNMKWSGNYLDNKNYAVGNVRKRVTATENMDAVDKGILLKFPIIHTRYNEIEAKDFGVDVAQLRYRANWSRQAYPVPEAVGEAKVGKLTASEMANIDDMVRLSKERGFDLVFWVAPYIGTKAEARKYNAIGEYATQSGAGFINFFNLLEETGFDFETDMRKEALSGSHMNNSGSEKITRYLGSYLEKQFDMPNRWGDAGYSRYDELAREWRVTDATHRLQSARQLDDFMENVDQDLFDVTALVFTEVGATIDKLAGLTGQETGIPGLYTAARQNAASHAWDLSERVKLSIPGDDIRKRKLYDSSSAVEITDCDLCVIVVDKHTGRLIDKAQFNKKDEGYIRA